MKKLLILIVLCLTISSYGQSSNNENNCGIPKPQIDSLHVNITQVAIIDTIKPIVNANAIQEIVKDTIPQKTMNNNSEGILNDPSDFVKINDIEQNSFQVYFESGKSKYNSEDYKGAIADFSKVIKLDPDYVEAYLKRGQSKYKLENYRGAIIDFTKTIALNPYYREAYYLRGISKFESKNPLEAIADYTKAIEINPNGNGEVYYFRGVVKTKLEDYSGAFACQ